MAKKAREKAMDEEEMLNHQMQDEEEDEDEDDEEQEEETPREESEEEGSRIERSKVLEDNTIFDEVFEGKKQKRVEQKIEEKPKKKAISSESRDKQWEQEIEVPSKQEIREKILRKAEVVPEKKLEELEEELDEAEEDTEIELEIEDDRVIPLKLLEDGNNVFIGRKKNIFQKYGYEAAVYIGKISEENFPEKNVFMDGLNPHVVFVCGARGSGKSYLLGIIAEELAKKNKNVGLIVVDPIGVFWSMKYPNKEEKELNALKQWNLKPEGLNNVKVFIPEGMKHQVPKTTFDATFAIQPSLLTVEDWCLTFGMDRFGPTGLLLDKLLKNVSHGYKTIDGKYVKAKKADYSLDDFVDCLGHDGELNSSEKGYKMDSIRALVSRFEAAKTWGVFSDKGTPLAELSRENQLSILDTSFLEDNVTALVIGILARRILAARKISTRKEAVQRLKSSVEEMLELDIPATWLFIDEAHTLVPSGNFKTAASDAIVEYVKQGRRPGCSLVFATQQPSAINTKVLSQLDIIIAHKLVFDDDIKAVYKRTPTIIPGKYKKASFIKTLPVGVALTGDRQEETSRAFVMKVRPRKSQHEGREAETVDSGKKSLEKSQVLEFAVQSLDKDLKRKGEVGMETMNQLIELLNTKYGAKLLLSEVLDALEEKGYTIEPKRIINPEAMEEEEAMESLSEKETEIIKPSKKEKQKIEAEEIGEIEKAVERTELGEKESFSLPKRITLKQAEHLVDGRRKKKFLGIFGKEEEILESKEVSEVIYKVSFHEFNESNEFVPNTCFVSSRSGEFIHFVNNNFVQSQGFTKIGKIKKEEADILKSLLEKVPLEKKIKSSPHLHEENVRDYVDGLASKGFVFKQKAEGKTKYSLNKAVELPTTPRHSLLASINHLPITREGAMGAFEQHYSKEEISKSLQTLFPNIVIKRVSELFRPMYLIKVQGEKNFLVDAFTGSIVS